MDGNQVMEYQSELRRKVLIGMATGLGSMILVAIVVFTFLVLYRNHQRKKTKSGNVEMPGRRSSRWDSDPPPGSASSLSSANDIDPEDIRLSLENFSFGNSSSLRNEDLGVRLENELDPSQRAPRNRHPSGSYSAAISHLENVSHRLDPTLTTGSRSNYPPESHRIDFSPDYNQHAQQNPSRRDLPEIHFGRSISADPYIRPHDNHVTSVSRRSHSLDVDRQLNDFMSRSSGMAHAIPKTLPARTRYFERDRYLERDVIYDGIRDGRRFERSDLATELSGYFDNPVNKRSDLRNENGKLDGDYRDASDSLRRDHELWTQRFDYTEFNRLPRIPLSFSGNRRFLTEHPQRNIFRPI